MSSSKNRKCSRSVKAPETVTLDEDTISESVRSKVKDFSKSIDGLKVALRPITENLSRVESASDAVNKARLDLTAVYTLNSLFWLYLLSQGKNPKDHDVKRELDRLKVSMARLRDLESNANESTARKVDSSVAKRVIKHSLSLNSKVADEKKEEQEATCTGSKRIKKS